MTIIDAIKARHSVRAFRPDPLPGDVRSQLEAFIAEDNAHSGLHLQLVTDEPDAFGRSLLAHYGKFSNANNYVAVVGPPLTDTLAGFYGERVVLFAQTLGLNTCWAALTFRKGPVKHLVPKGERIYALIAIGYGQTQGNAVTKKAPQKISPDYDTAPQWFRDGVDAAVLAPSALNQQKYTFRLQPDGKVLPKRGTGFYTKIDLGIAMYHFKMGAGEENVSWARP